MDTAIQLGVVALSLGYQVTLIVLAVRGWTASRRLKDFLRMQEREDRQRESLLQQLQEHGRSKDGGPVTYARPQAGLDT